MTKQPTARSPVCLGYSLCLLVALLGSVNAQETHPQIEWLISRQDTNTWLVDSYEDDARDEAWTYDQALAVIAFTEADEQARASMTLAAMGVLQITNGPMQGAWWECYQTTDPSVVCTNCQSCTDMNVISGPVAWMVMALNFYEAYTGETNYAPVAEDALAYLSRMMETNPADEAFGTVTYSTLLPDVISTEHNLDAYSAFLYRGLLVSNETHVCAASNILDYLATEMWCLSTNCNWPDAFPPKSYARIPLFWRGRDDWNYATDAQSWGVLALGPMGPDGEPFHECTEWLWANEHGNTRLSVDFDASITNVDGFKSFTGEGTNYIWVEGTEGVAAAFRRVGGAAANMGSNDLMTTSYARAEWFHEEMTRVMDTNGGLAHSFSDHLPAWKRFPENARWNHAASVAWFYFNEAGINPFAPPIPHPGGAVIRHGTGTTETVEIGWTSIQNWPHKIQKRDSLNPNTDGWRDHGVAVRGTGEEVWVPDTDSSSTQRFYRVLLGK